MKNNKNNYLIYLIFIITFFIIYFILTKNTYLFASTKDFRYQHYLIPEYFRTLFYSTHDLFPDFSLNLGGGQNIYYLSYYGLYNPYILLSYLFPNIKMIYYLITINILIVLSSTIIMFKYLKKNNYNTITSFIISFLFLTCGPLIFHAKRHIMFINYFPFLLLAISEIDNYVKNKKITKLTIFISLIILSSYYFSISAILVLYVYYIYKLIKLNNKITLKKLLHFTIPFILSIMITSILTLPTFYILFNGRTSTIKQLNYIKLFIPSPLKTLLYNHYSIGLTLISLIALIYYLFKRNKSNNYLAVICLLFITFPIFNYILNGTLYINSKTLIPFIPLILLLTADFLQNVLKKISKQKQIILITYLLLSSFTICIYTNLKDELIPKKGLKDTNYKTTQELINEITNKDKTIYRINNDVFKSRGINKVTNIKEYKSTIYSSTYNKRYIKLYNSILNNPIPNRNKFMLAPSNNIFSEILLSEKYIVTKRNMGLNLELIKEKNNIKVYKNNSVLPLGYASNKLINKDTFKKLKYPNSSLALLNNIIIDKTENTNSVNIIKKETLNYEIKDYKNIEINKINNNIIIKAKPLATMTIKLNKDLKNKILFLRMKNNINNNEDLNITINSIKNTLTDKRWKYYNANKTFDYCIYDTNILNISFREGNYNLNNIEAYIVDYETIKDINKKIDPFIINTKKTKGDIIEGKIKINNNNSYFTISIPYDKGFNIKVDNQKINYQKSGANFITFPIKKGSHTIKIEYNAPLKNISLIISTIGILLLLIYNKINNHSQ